MFLRKRRKAAWRKHLLKHERGKKAVLLLFMCFSLEVLWGVCFYWKPRLIETEREEIILLIEPLKKGGLSIENSANPSKLSEDEEQCEYGVIIRWKEGKLSFYRKKRQGTAVKK